QGMSELRSGLRLLVGCCLGMSIGISSLYFYSIGTFLKPLAEEFGWARGTASTASMIGTVAAALIAPAVGRLVDRFGAARVALASLAVLAASFAALGALTQGLSSFLTLITALSLLATGSSAIPFGRIIVSAFHRQRGVALGIALSGAGFGAMLMPPLLVPYVASHGWRAGYFALALVIVVGMPLVAWLLRPVWSVAAPVTAAATARDPLMRHPAFVRLAFVFFCASMAIFATVVHFVPLLTDAGLEPARAGALAGLIGITAIGGRVIAGGLLDRFRAARVTAAMFLVSAAGMLALAFGGVALAVPGALIAGFAIGAENDLLAFLVARYFPRELYGRAYGALYGVFLIGGAVGPALSGMLFDMTGSYFMSLVCSAGLLVLTAGATRLFQTLRPVEAG
ncbi:MAG: MFS transporter, partial [Pseudomonadota bacterium]